MHPVVVRSRLASFSVLVALLLAACGQRAAAPPEPATSNVVGAPVATQALTDNAVYTLSNQCSGKRLDVLGLSQNDQATVAIWTPNMGLNQQWKLVPKGSGYYQLIAQHSQKALDVKGGATAAGTTVWQYTVNPSNAQLWKPVDVGGGQYKLVSRVDGSKVLDVTGAGTTNGTKLELWNDTGSCAQHWSFASVGGGATTGGPNTLVSVPASMRSAPFDVERRLNIPTGFSVAVYARVSSARFLLALPDGSLLVSLPGAGKVVLLRPGVNGGDPTASDFVTGLASPHDLVLDGGFLYISEKNRVSRVAYTSGQTTAGSLTPIVTGLPDSSLSELKGAYGHELKNIAVSGGKLYISIASATNADPSDLAATPKRGAVYAYSASTPNQAATSGTLFAQGIRNAEGLAFAPGSSDLWVVVNNRDNVAYPFHKDFSGDGTDDYGKVLPAYVDNHPPEEVIKLRAGGNYGWPFCNPDPDAGVSTMPFDRDVQNNADGSKLNCDTADRVTRGIQAHSAPLGATFWSGANVPGGFQNGLVVGLHGSWNRTTISGNKFVFFPYSGGSLGGEQDLVSGFLSPSRWGRPVDAAVAPDGGLYLSDDYAGAIYKLTPSR